MPTVTVNMPKTPCTKGSNTIAAATVPNICKMPGPPAPFVPTPLPNIGKSGKAPQKDFSKTVKIEGNDVAIKGTTFGSMGDIASKGLGGGLISMNCEGPTSFVAPGSMNSKIEGKNIQFLGDQMLNNNGPSGNPPNSACMMGATHAGSTVTEIVIDCTNPPPRLTPISKCQKDELCKKVRALNKQKRQKKLNRRRRMTKAKADKDRRRGIYAFVKAKKAKYPKSAKTEFWSPICHEEWKNNHDPADPFKKFSPDHVRDIQFFGHYSGVPQHSNLKWMTRDSNEWIGRKMQDFRPGMPIRQIGCCK
jgi:uncharacterized Zn-binding protein involved in type VI secretion